MMFGGPPRAKTGSLAVTIAIAMGTIASASFTAFFIFSNAYCF
jgi:hypothetical protein